MNEIYLKMNEIYIEELNVRFVFNNGVWCINENNDCYWIGNANTREEFEEIVNDWIEVLEYSRRLKDDIWKHEKTLAI